jgi:hypothetical protein
LPAERDHQGADGRFAVSRWTSIRSFDSAGSLWSCHLVWLEVFGTEEYRDLNAKEKRNNREKEVK